MKNNCQKRPSHFALSRFILNECDESEKKRIESWITSSPQAEKEFEIFKNSLAIQEQNAPRFEAMVIQKLHPKKKVSLIHNTLLFKNMHPMIRAALILLTLTLFTAVVFTLNLKEHLPSTITLKQQQTEVTHAMTLHDTLKALQQICSLRVLSQYQAMRQTSHSQISFVHTQQRFNDEYHFLYRTNLIVESSEE